MSNPEFASAPFTAGQLNALVKIIGPENVEGILRGTIEVITKVVNMIVRLVRPNRNLKPRQALEATGRNPYVNDEVVANMPRGEGDETEVIFFKVGRFLSDDDLEKEYELRGLKHADPYSVAKANEDDPTFADDHPNGTHWRDENGKWCFVTFDGWGGGRYVDCSRNDNDWSDSWWFAGLRK
jgi:hypothetical protein